MAYDQNNPAACLMDGFASAMPRLFLYSSTHTSTDISLTPATSSTTATGVGFFKDAGEYSHGLAGIGMRVGDIVMHVSRATLATSDFPSGFPGLVTIHSVIASTPNGSTVASSVSYDVTLGQSSV